MGLTLHQQEKMRDIISLIQAGHKRILLKGSAGVGKLQPDTEPVLTPNGWRLMKDIQPGSLVIGKDGNPITVLNTFRGTNLKIYKVNFCDGSSTECCEDHLWQIQTVKLKSLGKYRVMSLKDIIPNIKLNGGVRSGFRYSIDLPEPVNFNRNFVRLDPYLLGSLLGNGYFAEKGSVYLSMEGSKVQEMYDKILTLVPQDVSVRFDQKYLNNTGVGRIIFSSEIKPYLNDLGLLGYLSSVKFIPKEYLYNSVNIRLDLLAGLMDTDGSIEDCGNRKKVSYSTISERLANDIQELGRSLGGYCVKTTFNRQAENKGVEYRVTIRTQFNPFELNSRKDIFNKYDWKFSFTKRIVSVEYLGLKDGQCLLVNSSDHLYITKDYTVTHNTFMTNELIYVLKTTLYEYGAVYITAPTHKALAVLKGKIEEKPYIKFQTIHSALSLKAVRDSKTGKQIFIQKINERYPPFLGAQVVILDEASMIGYEIQSYIDAFPELLFIYIGDQKQLPPVGEVESAPFLGKPIVWNKKGIPEEWIPYPEVELTEIIRQGKGSPIIELSRNLHLITSKDNNMIDGQGYIFDNDRHYIIERLAEINGTDDIKYISWTNTDADKVNFDVRRRIYGNPGKIELGESIVFKQPHKGFKINQELKIEDIEIIERKLGVPSEDTLYTPEATLIKRSHDSIIETIDIKIYRVNDGVTILHEDSHEIVAKAAKEIKSKIAIGLMQWPAYYTFIEQFATFTYNHALTTHTSQGSTFQTCIMNVGNMLLNKNKPELQRLLYTGVTRAAKVDVLYNVR